MYYVIAVILYIMYSNDMQYYAMHVLVKELSSSRILRTSSVPPSFSLSLVLSLLDIVITLLSASY